MSQTSNLPAPEISERTWLLYENIATNNPDRTGNWRFRLEKDGCFFNARNQSLLIEDPTLLSSSDSALYWNTSFPKHPQRCLTESQVSELTSAIEVTDFDSLNQTYSNPPHEVWSHSSIERWTLIQADKVVTITVSNRAAPARLVQLRQVIDRLVSEAPQPEQPTSN